MSLQKIRTILLASALVFLWYGVSPVGANNHSEFTMGFIGGQKSYTQSVFQYANGGGEIPGHAALTEPFLNDPFNQVSVMGLRWEGRVVFSHVRMTVGFDLPFTSFNGHSTIKDYKVGQQVRTIGVQALDPYELRFGLGGEYTLPGFKLRNGKTVLKNVITPYFDVIGAVQWIQTSLTIDGLQVNYQTRTFGFSLRGGVRLAVEKWFFVTVSGHVGMLGSSVRGAELSVGFRTP